MKNIFHALPLSMLVLLNFASVSFSANYAVVQITDNNFNDTDPLINDNDYVAWWGGAYSDNYNIFLYDGSSITQITDNDSLDHIYDLPPKINDSGDVVWEEDSNIFLYDGVSVTQITDSAGGYFGINDSGHVVWEGDSNIFLYDGLSITQLTDNGTFGKALWPKINNSGDIVWWGYENYFDYDLRYIYLYDNLSSAVTQFSALINSHTFQINDSGYVAWQGSADSSRYVFLYDGSTVTQIYDNVSIYSYPQINNSGYVVWYGVDGSDYDIFLYDGSNVTQLTHNDLDDQDPQINDSGDVVWEGDGDIFLYDGSSVTQLTDNGDFFEPQINNNGCIVWYGQFADESGSNEIYYAYPFNTGDDTDGDGLTDGDEVNTYGTNPLNPDTDGDGLTDWDEVNTYGTNPLNPDTDGDGLSDGEEVAEGADSMLADTENGDNSGDNTADDDGDDGGGGGGGCFISNLF